jgi:hypothetical protein
MINSGGREDLPAISKSVRDGPRLFSTHGDSEGRSFFKLILRPAVEFDVPRHQGRRRDDGGDDQEFDPAGAGHDGSSPACTRSFTASIVERSPTGTQVEFTPLRRLLGPKDYDKRGERLGGDDEASNRE